MSQLVGRAEPTAVVERLRDATNAHDLEGIVACFAAEYRNETPLHPGRGFVGNDQVRRNWRQILAAIPDVSTETSRPWPRARRCGRSGSTVARDRTARRT